MWATGYLISAPSQDDLLLPKAAVMVDSRWDDIYKFEFLLTLMTIMFFGLVL